MGKNKNIIILLNAFMVFFFATTFLMARKGHSSEKYNKGVILKAGFAMTDDSEALADYENTWIAGLFIDLGPMIMDPIRFITGLDYISIENGMENATIYAVHLEWRYNIFISGVPVIPFAGLGPSLNYVDWGKSSQSAYDDSEVGLDVFAGAAYNLSGTQFQFFAEARYRNIDIAYRKKYMIAVNLGAMIKI